MGSTGGKRRTVSHKCILLVEDDSGVRTVFSVLLGLDGHTVTEAERAAQALELFTKGRFDLVITDFEMPGMKGDELAVRIKELAPGQPILMVTGWRKQLGDPRNPVDAILNKPFNLQALRKHVARLLCRPGGDGGGGGAKC